MPGGNVLRAVSSLFQCTGTPPLVSESSMLYNTASTCFLLHSYLHGAALLRKHELIAGWISGPGRVNSQWQRSSMPYIDSFGSRVRLLL